jgi:serine/threonine-protein kinase
VYHSVVGCYAESELVEFADGRLPADRLNAVSTHLDACAACRGVVVELARGAQTELDPRASNLRAAPTPTSANIFATYLAKDARERELSASRLAIAILVVGVGVQGATAFSAQGSRSALAIGILAAFLAYEIPVHMAMRRGWFHRLVPVFSTCVEVSIGFAIAVSISSESPRELVSTPWHIFEGGLVVFFAVRAAPWLCLLAGALAATEELVIYLLAASRLPDLQALAFMPAGAGLRALLFLACGVGGAMVARHFVERAADALREIREQDMFGRYLLGERLGQGGMGEVYRATYSPEGGFVRTVAVKKMREHLADAAFAEAFKREACLAASLVHPNLVQVIDCGRFRGAFVFVMEYVDGISLQHLLRARGGALPAAAVAYIGAELAAALAFLHNRHDEEGKPLELVHCDLNPPNVLLSRAGEVKLADFGVMRARTPDGGQKGSGGKPSYAAPEQLEGRSIDGRTDLFALGLTLHEALTGKRVFSAERNALVAVAPPLPQSVPAQLRELIASLVDREPEKRPASAAEVQGALLALTGDLAPAPGGRSSLVLAIREHPPRSPKVLEETRADRPFLKA